MPRKRQLPPDIAQWKGFKVLSHDARLLYLLLHTIADDEGRMREDAGYFAYQLFPGETGFGLKIEACLREMEREDLIRRYEAGCFHYCVITAWEEQKISHPTPSKLPPPPDLRTLLFDELKERRIAKQDR